MPAGVYIGPSAACERFIKGKMEKETTVPRHCVNGRAFLGALCNGGFNRKALPIMNTG